jgi:hypothetical protein
MSCDDLMRPWGFFLRILVHVVLEKTLPKDQKYMSALLDKMGPEDFLEP